MEVPHPEGLTREEDDSLRRLAYFAENAGLSKWSQSRLHELRLHDRRAKIRLPREVIGDPDDDEVVDSHDQAGATGPKLRVLPEPAA
jgi:hypothetical protein